MEQLKWILITVGAVLVLFAGVLAFIAATFDPNQYKGQVADLVKEKSQRALAIEGNIRLTLFPEVGVQLGKTRLSEFRSDKEFAGLEQMRVSLALLPLLSKQVVLDQVQLDGLRVNLVRHKDGTTNFADLIEAQKAASPATAPPSEAAAPIRFDIDGVKVSNAAVSWRDEVAGTGYTVSNLDLETARVAPGVPVKIELAAAFTASEPKLDVKLQCSGNVTVDPQNRSFSVAVLTAWVRAQGPQLETDLNIKLSGVEGSAKALQVREFLITGDARQADNAVKGTLSTPIVADFETQLFELPKLAGELDVASPALPMKKLKVPLAGTLRADLGKEKVNADLTAHLDESNIKARIDIADFAAPFTRFEVAIDKLNVDRYFPPTQKGEVSAEPAPSLQAEQTIDFSPIKKLNLAGSLRIDELIASNVKAQNVRMDVKAKGGRLEVNPLSANLYQGSAKVTASVNANNNQLAIRQNLSGISIGPLLRDALKQDLLDGRGNVALNVDAIGNTISAIRQSLNGSAALNVKDGALKGINLAQSLRNAKAMFTGGARETEQAAAAGEKTDFSELSASFLIREGVAHNDDLLVTSPFLRLTGAGDINIAEGRLNYLAKATAVATSTGQAGKELADIRGLTLPVRASGPFTALIYKLEFGSAFSDSAKQQFEEKKEELKDKLEDELKSRLPGAKKPAGGAAPATGEESAPPQKPEDKLKEKLKEGFQPTNPA